MSIASDPAGRVPVPAGAARDGALHDGSAPPRHLFGPAVDFLGLGGASLLLLPLILLLPARELAPDFKAVLLTLAYAINYPHFAFSYQIFYEGFRAKAFGDAVEPALRRRYRFAGIGVPAALAAFFALCLAAGDARTLGYAANLMGLLVGWHYVKQGYGMLMVDAALKRLHFRSREKRVLLVNAWAVWGLAWLMVNWIHAERGLWGIRYAMLDIPPLAIAVALCVAVGSSVAAVRVLAARWRANGGRLPWTGVAAYGVSLYVWLLLMHANILWLLLVPALHSIQYILVVARFRLNRCRDAAAGNGGTDTAALTRAMARFAGIGVLLGWLGFWGLPWLCQALLLPYDRAAFGGTAFLFVFWIFINVHHYCLDNVMWRRENPEMRRYLFG